MTSHRDVAQRLAGSKNKLSQSLKGTNMEFEPYTEEKPARVIGYGWATYAIRIDDTVIIDWSWRGYSTSTTQHLTILEREARRSECVNLVYVGQTAACGGVAIKAEVNSKWDRQELGNLGPVNARPTR